MAAHDPIDPLTGSQDFYHQFYQFHKTIPFPWFIKDTDHRYTDGSDAFCARFLPNYESFQVGMTDSHISSSDRFTIELMHSYESFVMEHNEIITLLVSGYFDYSDPRAAYFINIYPISDGRSGVIGYIRDLKVEVESSNLVEKFINHHFPVKLCCDAELLETSIDPHVVLTDSEWEIIWLRISGKSFKQISQYLNVQKKTVEKKLDSIYHKLKIFGVDSLLTVANQNSWIRYVPSSLMPSHKILRIS